MVANHNPSTHQLRRAKNSRRGAAMIEFALCLPILLLLVFSIIELGRALMVHQILTNGAREGARLAVIPGSTDAQVFDKIDTYMNNAGISGFSRTVTPSIASASPGDQLTVDVSVPFNQVSWGTNWLGIDAATLSSSVIMRKE